MTTTLRYVVSALIAAMIVWAAFGAYASSRRAANDAEAESIATVDPDVSTTTSEVVALGTTPPAGESGTTSTLPATEDAVSAPTTVTSPATTTTTEPAPPSSTPTTTTPRSTPTPPPATTTPPPANTEPPVTATTAPPPATTAPPPATTTTQPPVTTTSPSGEYVDSGPLTITGKSGVVISGLRISNPDGPCIWIADSDNITIAGNLIGPCGRHAVAILSSTGVSVSSNDISGTGWGINATDSVSVQVEGNTFTNAGRNFVLFDNVTGTDNRIRYNIGENQLGGSNAEDMINLYQSHGTAGDPIQVVGNRLRNGGPSGSGSGIMTGDGGGSHQLVKDNRLVNPGQVGIGVASGQNIRVLDNLVYSASQPWTNVGIYVWNQYSSACSSIEVQGNQVNWTNRDGEANPQWDGENCGTITGWANNDWNANIGPGIF